jgi:uncharacterized protein
MRFVNYVRYVADQEKVSAIRPDHQKYVRKLISEGKLILAGPFADGSGGLFVYEAESMDGAKAIAADDPYNTGGAFSDFRISEWDLRAMSPGLLQVALDSVVR